MARQKRMKKTPARIAFEIINYALCILIGLLCVLPVIHILAVSFSGKYAVFSGNVGLWPVDFTTANYQLVIRDAQFFSSYRVSILRAVLGWAVSLTMVMLAAYPMSLRKSMFPARSFFVWYFMGTMLFSGGMIPTYLVVKTIGLTDSIWALVLPGAVGTYNIILMMNFIKSLPEALSESAFIDGAGHLRTMVSIVLPLCMPSIATVSLFIILGHWNAWFDGMIYITRMDLKPLQTYLRSIILVDARSTVSELSYEMEEIMANVTVDAANGAKIFLALLPILLIYPFMQKHFAKGIVRGSVKE